MRDPLARLPIKYKLTLTFVFICLVAFGVGGLIVSTDVQNALEREILARLAQEAKMRAVMLDRGLELLGRRTEDFASDGYIRTLTEAAVRGGGAAVRERAHLSAHLLMNKVPLVEAFLECAVYDPEGRFVAGSRGKPVWERMPSTAEEAASLRYGALGRDAFDRAQFPISTPLWDLQREKRIGTLVSWVDAHKWLAGAAAGSADHLVVSDLTGSELEFAPSLNRSDGLRYEESLSLTGWKLHLSVDASEVRAPVAALQSRFLGVGLIVSAAALSLIFFPMRFLVRPIEALRDAARRIREGDLTARVENGSTDEIGQLGSSFNDMADAIEDHTHRLEENALSLERNRNELRMERDRLNTVVRAMKDGFVLLRGDGGIELSNAAAEPLVRLLAAEKDLLRIRDCPHGETAAGACSSCLMHGRQIFRREEPAQTCVVEIDHIIYEILTTRLPAPAGEEANAGRVLLSRNITERVLMTSRQAHQERLAVLGEVAAVMAHELNNPLAAISMFTQILDRELPREAAQRDYVDVIRRNTEHCRDTVKSLLNYANQSTLEMEEFDLHELLDDTVRFLRPLMKRSHVGIGWRLDLRNPRVVSDARLLRQVFVNIVMNSLQALGSVGERSGEPEGMIRVMTDEDAVEGTVMIEIRDNGPGVPEHLRSRVFEPFFTTKPVGHGTGLGLAVSRRIVDSLGGVIAIEPSAADEVATAERPGARFVIRLPRRSQAKRQDAYVDFSRLHA